MFEPKLGVSLKVLTHNLTDDWSDALARSPIETFEITPYMTEEGRIPDNVANLHALLDRTDIRVATIHAKSAPEYDFSVTDEAAWRRAVDGFAESLDMAVDLDAKVVIIHTGHEPITDDERPARIRQARRGLAELTEPCRRTGVKTALELLPRSCLGNTVEECFALIDGLDEDVFGVCLDTNHLMDRAATLSDVVRQLDGRLIALHLSDYDGVDEKHWMPGKGVLDWKVFMQALRDVDYQGPFTYECRFDGDTPDEMIACLKRNFDWLTSL